ncbi:hypothetical protein EWW49_27930 [Pseudomonas syringae]|nr:hypothetical protein EWW49_27930 [Pseudomonas syringae]
MIQAVKLAKILHKTVRNVLLEIILLEILKIVGNAKLQMDTMLIMIDAKSVILFVKLVMILLKNVINVLKVNLKTLLLKYVVIAI